VTSKEQELGPVEQESAPDLQRKLTKLLRPLLKPLGVKRLIISNTDGTRVRGVVITVCPLEKKESGMDFEVGLEGNLGGSIKYATVDGRTLPLQKARASKRKTARN